MADDSGLRTALLLKLAENVQALGEKCSAVEARLSEMGVQDEADAKELKRLLAEINNEINTLKEEKLTIPKFFRVMGREWHKAILIVISAVMVSWVTGFIDWIKGFFSG